MAARNWNPSEPTVLGLEWPGIRSLSLPLSQEVEYGHTFQANATETIDQAAFLIVEPSVANNARATALVTVYKRDSNDPLEAGDETEYGIVNSTIIAPNGGSVTAPTTLTNAATVAEALLTPSDFKYITVPSGGGGGHVAIEFATAGLFTGKRILEVKLHFVAKAFTFGAIVPTAVLNLIQNGFNSLGDVVFIDEADPAPIPGPFYLRPGSTVRTVSLGEVDYGNAALANRPFCWPWTVAGVQLFDTTTTVEFRPPLDPESSAYGLDYAALEVVWCEENRQAVGALLMGAGTFFGETPMSPGLHSVQLRQPDGTDNWAKVVDNFYAATLTSARCPTIGFPNAGAAPFIPLVDRFEIFTQHQGRIAPRLPSNVLASNGLDSRLCPLYFITGAGSNSSDTDPYHLAFGAPVQVGDSATQDIEQRSGGGVVAYPWLRFYTRMIGDHPGVSVQHTTGYMDITKAEMLAFPEIFNGWRQVTKRWPAGQEPLLDNSGTDYQIQFISGLGDLANHWEVLGESADRSNVGIFDGGPATYGNVSARYSSSASGAHTDQDLVVTLHTDPPEITDFSVGTEAQPLIYLDEYCVVEIPVPGGAGYEDEYSDEYLGDPFETVSTPEPCFPSAYAVNHVTWSATTIPAADFAYYEIVRSDDYDSSYPVVAKILDQDQVIWYDYEALVGVSTSYKMRVARTDGIFGPYTAPAAATASAYGAQAGSLFFSSNVSTDYLVYPESFESAPSEAFSFPEAEWMTVQHFFGRFGQQSFHPTERGGTKFERTILVNALAVPTEGTADNAFDALRDIAWANTPYVCVKDEQGNRWFATLIVPEGNIRRQKHIHLANIQVVESTQTPFPASA